MTTRLRSSAGPNVVDRVSCLTTPGETIDAVVTEGRVAVNPRRGDLKDRLVAAGIEVMTIEGLHARARKAEPAAPAGAPSADRRIVAVIEYRDGRVIDVVREVAR